MKKNIFIIVNAVLAAAVIGLYILYFCCTGGKPVGTMAKSDETVATDGSVVYVQIDSLVQDYDMFHDLKLELEKKAEKIRKDLDNKGKAFEFKVKDFEEKVQKGLLTRSQAEQQQVQLQQEQANLQQYAQKVQNEMGEEEAVMFRRIFDAIQTFLAEYNQVHNYSLILSTSGSTNAVLQGSPSLDITKDVLNGLNARYKK
ncbi:MAG: OmpH family outer membrane protein [Prevotellaceae bacterium]|jgi:outer membrane protein|nr:OmpH family outer membrane protein [Prevotellaceae bacterium]